MKKRSFLIFALLFITGALFSQQLSYKFTKPRVIRVAGFDCFEFDVQVKADAAGTYLWGSQIILNFDNTTLTTTALQWTVTRAAAFSALNTLGNPKYSLIKTVTGVSPNCVLNIALPGDINASPNGGNADDFVEITTSYQTIVTVRGRITGPTGVAGINFKQASMNGQQSYINNPGEYINYTDPNLYDGADFTSAYVGRFYATTYGWSQVGNTVNAQWVNWPTAVNTTVWEGTAAVPGGSESFVSALLIYNGATLTVPYTGQLTASGNTTNNGTFTIQSDVTGTGSFVNTGTTTIGGTGTYNAAKYLTPTDTRWWYIGSPMLSANATAFGTLSAVSGVGTRLLYFNEAGQAYTAVIAGATLNTPLQGFSFRNYGIGTTTVAFSGAALNSGAIGTSTNLTRAAAGAYMGYNLVCNPYPSAINWGSQAIPTSGLTQTNLEPSIWYRSSGTFATYNWTSGTGQNGGQQNIPAMQAFWVRVASGTQGGLELANTTRLHSSQAFYKITAETNVFRMNVSDGINPDEVVVGFYQNAQDIFEAYDSEKMFANDDAIPQAYTLTSDNEKVAINGQPEFTATEDRVIPLGFTTSVAGTFTFEATNLADFDPSVSVFLEDVQQSVTQDLRQIPSYSFSSVIVDDADRFLLHFNYGITNISSMTENNIFVYAVNNSIYVNSPYSEKGNIEVYDVLGKLIVSKESVKGLNSIVLNCENGVYFVKVKNNTQIVSKKVLISK